MYLVVSGGGINCISNIVNDIELYFPGYVFFPE